MRTAHENSRYCFILLTLSRLITFAQSDIHIWQAGATTGTSFPASTPTKTATGRYPSMSYCPCRPSSRLLRTGAPTHPASRCELQLRRPPSTDATLRAHLPRSHCRHFGAKKRAGQRRLRVRPILNGGLFEIGNQDYSHSTRAGMISRPERLPRVQCLAVRKRCSADPKRFKVRPQMSRLLSTHSRALLEMVIEIGIECAHRAH